MNTEEKFRKDFSDLLRKYNAEFDVSVDMLEFGPDIVGISVYIPDMVTEEGYQEGVTIQFTKWFDSDL